MARPETDQTSAPETVVTPIPEGMTPEQWAAAESLGKKIGNISLAAAILDTDAGIYPDDPDDLVTFLDVSRGLETKAMKTFLKLNSTIGPKLKAAAKEYHEHRQRTLRLFGRISDGIDGTNGHDA